MAYHPLVHPVAAVDPLVMNFAMAVASQSGNTQAMLRLVAGGESTNDVELNSTSFDGREFSDKVNAKKRNLHKTKFAFYFELYGMNSRDGAGGTPLLRVLYFAHELSVVSKLIEIGPDLTIVDNFGANVLHYAVSGCNV